MIRFETDRSENSGSSTLLNRDKNSGTENLLAGSKRDVRAFLNASLRIRNLAPWTLALKPKPEAAAFSRALNSAQWSEFLAELSSSNALGLFVGVEAWAEVQNLEMTLRKILGPKCPHFSYPRLKSDSSVVSSTDRTMEFALCDLKHTVAHSNDKTALQWKSAPADAPIIEPEVVFVPGLSMDTLGNRLGRGLGFYDRYLATHPHARRIGTIHSRFAVEEFSNHWIEKHDQPLEVLWTERGIYATPKFRTELNKELIS
jgi:hypothetical protein